MKYYTGIGSRTTPTAILDIMTHLATKLEGEGYTLRSGGANGADSAFEAGTSTKDIYLPWKGFNNNPSKLYIIPQEAFELAEDIHPAWNRCKPAVRKLHARNTQQVLGTDLLQPSSFLICYTTDGKTIGGTATAINLAIANNVEVINLGIPEHLKRIQNYLLK